MSKIWIGTLVLFLGVIASLQAAPDLKQTENIKKNFQAVLPDFQIDNITETPIPDLYEVRSGPMVLYVSKDGAYAVSGEIIELTAEKRNLTELARKRARVQAIQKFQKDMIVFAPKERKHTVTVFTDVDCGYCRKLHAEIKEMNDLGIAIQYLAFPRSGTDSKGYKKAISIWCAKDKQVALNLAKSGETIDEAVCDNHNVDAQYTLGVNSGVQGTPTLILEDGTLLPGYFPPERLLAVLTEAASAKE